MSIKNEKYLQKYKPHQQKAMRKRENQTLATLID